MGGVVAVGAAVGGMVISIEVMSSSDVMGVFLLSLYTMP
jgi:hypothetical protein